MNKKFEINQTKIKGGCQWERKVVTHNSKSDLPLEKFIKTATVAQAQNCILHSIAGIASTYSTISWP